jgi:hypothetical protein
MLATQHTDFESFANALGTLPNQPPVPMACEPSPSPIDFDAKAIVQHVVEPCVINGMNFKRKHKLISRATQGPKARNRIPSSLLQEIVFIMSLYSC